MATKSLDFPLGRPLAPAVLVRRQRPLTSGAAPLVGLGESVAADQRIADLPDGAGGFRPLLAGLAGRIVEVTPGQQVTIEGVAAVIQGLLGLGGTAAGPLVMLPRGESLAVVPIPAGGIILFPQSAPLMLMQRAIAGGALGIIAGSAAPRELEALARTDLSAVYDGLAPQPSGFPLALVLTEGLGAQPMNAGTYSALAQRLGDTVLVSGVTDPRRNVRPEAALSLPRETATVATPLPSDLQAGAPVRVAAGARRGASGEIVHVFAHRRFDSAGTLAPSAVVRLDDGTTQTLPLHTLDRVG